MGKKEVEFPPALAIDQLRRITEDCGKPSAETIASISDEQVIFLLYLLFSSSFC